MNNVVVTGAEGFLGRKVVSRLAADGFSVAAVDRVAHGGAALDGVDYHQADLADPNSLVPPSWPGDATFVLVHLAWDMRRHQGYAIQAEQVRQCAGLLDTWTGRGLVRLVAMGSAEEYGRRDGKIVESAGPVLPLSPYGWAKHTAHDLAQTWAGHCGIPVVWLRPFIIYGPGQRGDMMIPYAIECASAKKEATFTDGQQSRDFVYIDDVVDAIVRSVSATISGFNSINIGGSPAKVVDVLMNIARFFNVESLFHLGAKARRTGEPDVQIADVEQAKKLLGWSAKTDLPTGLQQTLLHHRS
jgi:nucleoside-diphosphate-sugar epimerase